MKFLILAACAFVLTDARLTIRHRRQVEREGSSSSSEGSDIPASEVVVIKDTVNPSLPGPLFLVPRLPGPGDAFDLDINEQDGTFTFGGMLPPHMIHHHHPHQMQHQSFAGLFDAIQRRFDEMTRNMMSFNNFGPGFNPTTDISSLPDDYNKTDSEIVEMGGHRYVKKTTTLKKGGPGASFFVRSTTFERVNENDNADVPAVAEDDDAKKERPAVDEEKPQESQPESSSSSPDPKDTDAAGTPVAPAADSSPKNEEGSTNGGSTPDIIPSSSESPSEPVASESEGSPVVVPDESNANEREREGEALSSPSPSSTTEQPSA